MIAVALLAAPLGTWIQVRRLRRFSEEYRLIAIEHGLIQQISEADARRHRAVVVFLSEEAAKNATPGVGPPSVAESDLAERARRAMVHARSLAEYSSLMKMKYERASNWPWLPIARDPFPPDKLADERDTVHPGR